MFNVLRHSIIVPTSRKVPPNSPEGKPLTEALLYSLSVEQLQEVPLADVTHALWPGLQRVLGPICQKENGL